MSIIHSLNLNEGGGITPARNFFKPEDGGHIIIGIGGTGIDALKSLKRKVYTFLEPSDPFTPVPRYDSIRFLALDTDEFSLGDPQNERDLQESEFVNFSVPRLWKRLDPHFPDGRASLKNRPDLNNWMSIDQLPPLLGPSSPRAIRQMGRFMLMERVQDVYGAIMNAVDSLQHVMSHGQPINIHILAGISGGTGSGCFIDVCYLVRSVLESMGIQHSKLFGYFFLPDVVISKCSVRGDFVRECTNRGNGYAALKELDYLMDLPAADDWFDQCYQNGLTIHTQRSPVDLCYLVSAADVNGNISHNAYTYCINVASDYIMACLTGQGFQANIFAAMSLVPRTSGANHCYTILGAANAEVPFSQIATYLAQGYYKKVADISWHCPTENEVRQFAAGEGLTWERLCSRLTRNTYDAALLANRLAEVGMRDCLLVPIRAAYNHPGLLVDPAEQWLAEFKAKVESNFSALSAPLRSYAEPDYERDSVISSVHRHLMELCRNLDGQHGAKFAAKLLSNSGFDMGDVVAGLIAENTERLMCEKHQHQYLFSSLREARDAFYCANIITRSSRWKIYLNAMVRWMDHLAKLFLMEKMDELLHILKDQLSTLYTEFYQKLDSLCDDLKDTFEVNAAFLADPQRRASAVSNTAEIIALEDLIPELDLAISAIDPIHAAVSLMHYLLDGSCQETWLSQSDVGIGGLISGFMLSQFSKPLTDTLDELIRRKYPGLTVPQVQNKIISDLLTPLNRIAAPMFWWIPAYTMDLTSAFAQSTLTVPAASNLLPAAAQEFKQRVGFHQNLEVCRSTSSDRVSVLRQISAVPLYAYEGLGLMQRAYEDVLRGGVAGIHLYEHNCVLEEKANKTPEDLERIAATAWGSYLPSPIPLSQTYVSGEEHSQEHKALEKLFSRAMELGVIARGPCGYWDIFENRWEEEHRLPSREDYVADDLFSWEKAEAEKLQCEELLRSWTSPDRCRTLILSGGNAIQYGYEKLVLLDRFVRFPRLAAAVRRSLDNYDYLLEKKAALEALLSAEELR